MHASPQTLTTPTPPPGVLQLVESALHRGLLEDVESLADGLQRTGWLRDTHGGWWTHEDARAWTIVSSIDPANVSIFATGPDDVVAAATDQIASQLTAGDIQGLATGETDDLGVRTWRAEAINLELYFDPTRTIDLPHKTIETPCTLHLAVARNDAPSDARFTNHERSRLPSGGTSPPSRTYLTTSSRHWRSMRTPQWWRPCGQGPDSEGSGVKEWLRALSPDPSLGRPSGLQTGSTRPLRPHRCTDHSGSCASIRVPAHVRQG